MTRWLIFTLAVVLHCHTPGERCRGAAVRYAPVALCPGDEWARRHHPEDEREHRLMRAEVAALCGEAFAVEMDRLACQRGDRN